jgi:hypothetical protein
LKATGKVEIFNRVVHDPAVNPNESALLSQIPAGIGQGYSQSLYQFYLSSTDFGAITGRDLHLFKTKSPVKFTASVVRLWSSVSGGGITVAIYSGTVNNLTRRTSAVINFAQAGYNTVTLDIPYEIQAGQEYFACLFATDSQGSSNNFIAAITAGSPVISVNLATSNANIFKVATGSATIPNTVTSGMTPATSGAKIPYFEIIQG